MTVKIGWLILLFFLFYRERKRGKNILEWNTLKNYAITNGIYDEKDVRYYIGGIVCHHCFHFLFIMQQSPSYKAPPTKCLPYYQAKFHMQWDSKKVQFNCSPSRQATLFIRSLFHCWRGCLIREGTTIVPCFIIGYSLKTNCPWFLACHVCHLNNLNTSIIIKQWFLLTFWQLLCSIKIVYK